MVLLTMIARILDGLPLAASVQVDEQVNTRVNITLAAHVFLPLP